MRRLEDRKSTRLNSSHSQISYAVFCLKKKFDCAYGALLRVLAGSLTTYGRLSAAIHQPQAARAVGSAVGANPIPFIIPCHRVIRETGVLGNYRWDPVRKRAILGWELAACSSLGLPDINRVHATAA